MRERYTWCCWYKNGDSGGRRARRTGLLRPSKTLSRLCHKLGCTEYISRVACCVLHSSSLFFPCCPHLAPPPPLLLVPRVDLRQRQDGSRYAFVEFGDCGHVQEIMTSGPFTLDDQTVNKRCAFFVVYLMICVDTCVSA